MMNPGRDAFNLDADDVLTDRRQAEIAHVAARLAPFRPSQVAIERNWRMAGDWQQDYGAYQAGAFALTRDERHPLGFRVAAQASVARITVVDWDDEDPAATGMALPNPWAYAAAHQPPLHRRMQQIGQTHISEMGRILAQGTVRDLLRWLNSPREAQSPHRMYLGVLELVGDPADPVEVGWLAGWYHRNLTIFANLVRLAASPSDRVFALYVLGTHRSFAGSRNCRPVRRDRPPRLPLEGGATAMPVHMRSWQSPADTSETASWRVASGQAAPIQAGRAGPWLSARSSANSWWRGTASAGGDGPGPAWTRWPLRPTLVTLPPRTTCSAGPSIPKRRVRRRSWCDPL